MHTIRAGDAVLLIRRGRQPGPRSVPGAGSVRLRSPKPTNRRTWSRHPLLPWRAAGEAAEGRVALQTVFERWPTVRQAGDLVYANNFNVRFAAFAAGYHVLSGRVSAKFCRARAGRQAQPSQH